MSIRTTGELIIDFISFRKTKIRKEKFEKFLSILYDSITSSCDFSKEVFLFLFPNIPYLIREKFYELILKKRIKNKKIFTKTIFVDTFLSLMYYPVEYLFKLFIDFFDYTNDSIIYSDDVNVIFYHIHHHNGNSDKLIYVKKFISDVFSYKKFLKKKEFIFIIKEKNSNLFYLFIFSLIFSLFKKKDIYLACEFLISELSIKKNPLLLLEQDYSNNNFQIIPPTEDLIEYLNQKFNIKLKEDKPFLIEENDENSLDDLNDFEKDVVYIKHNFSKIYNYSNTINIQNKYKRPLSNLSVDEMAPIIYTLPRSQEESKKTKVKFSFSPSMKEDILSQFKKRISNPKKISISNKKAKKAKTKELTLSFMKSTLKTNGQGSIKRKTIYPKDVIYPVFDSIFYTTEKSKVMHYIILRVFESFIVIENDLFNIIIPISKLFFIVDEEQREFKRRLLFPLQLISQLSYEKKMKYQFYFLSFQNRDKFVYQLKCILGNFNFKKQFILDKAIYENKYYSLYLGRKNDMFQSTIIKIKGSRYEEIDDLENSERFQIKIISKNCIKNLKNLIDEIEISKLLSNITYPNINNIENLFEDKDNIYIIFEHYYGDNISLYCDCSIEEKYDLIKQLYKGVKNLHNIGIIHTNLIPDFILVNEFQQIIITHINEAHLNLLFESNSLIIKNYKNYSFDCPEIIENKKCNYKVDYWNIGLIAFYLLYGFFPIDKENYYTFNLEKIIQKLNWDLNNNKKKKKINKEILQSLNSLIMNCVKLIPDDRGDEIEDILQIKRIQNRNILSVK